MWICNELCCLLEGMKINYGQIIIDEMFILAYKTASALLYRLSKVLIIYGVDNEIRDTKRHDIEKTRG